MHYQSDISYDEDYLKLIIEKVNALRYIKLENDLNSYELLELNAFDEVYCNDDWYIIIYKNGEVETFDDGLDERANLEIERLSNNKSLKRTFN